MPVLPVRPFAFVENPHVDIVAASARCIEVSGEMSVEHGLGDLNRVTPIARNRKYRGAQERPGIDNSGVEISTADDRRTVVRLGQRLEYFTVGWNCLEALVAIVAGIIARSVSLIGFGLDSLMEVASGSALLWRLHHDQNPSRREQVERATLRIVGWCFIALAMYITCESGSTLIRHEAPDRSIPGMVLAAVSLVVMPVLARRKRRVAARIGSGAMRADSRQTDFCAYLAAILLGGLLMNALFGWWWADPVAGLVMVPIIAKEGVDGLRYKTCCGCDSPAI
jgi:divalent metal cation (Fe/Co/Zn/Cd) transporter